MKRTLLTACLLALSVLAPGSRSSNDTEDLEAFVTEFFAAYGRMEVDRVERFYAESLSHEDPTGGLHLKSRAALDVMWKQSLATYTELDWKIETRVIQGDRAAVEGRVTGKISGRPFDVRFATFLFVKDSRVTRQIDYVDYASLQKQIGAGGK